MIFLFEHVKSDGVWDGDTFYAVIDLGVKVYTRQKIRLRKASAVELGNPPTQPGMAARDLLAQVVPAGLPIRVVSHGWTYDRIEGDVWLVDRLLQPTTFVNSTHLAALRAAGLEGGN